MYSGFPIGILVLALLGGRVSKKNMMMMNLVISLLGMCLIEVGKSIYIAGVGMFCCVYGLNINLNICYPFIAETVASKHRPKFSMLLAVFYTFGALANVFWFYAFPNF